MRGIAGGREALSAVKPAAPKAQGVAVASRAHHS